MRLGRVLLALLGLLVLAYLVGSVDWRPDRPGHVRRVSDALVLGPGISAGAAVVEHTPSRPLPLGGYVRRGGARHDGVRDPLHVRALVLGGRGEGRRLAIVSLESVLVPGPLAWEVAARLEGFDVVVTATHTHSAPGAHWDNPIAERGGLGPFDYGWTEELTRAAVYAVRSADGARRPATMTFADAEGPDVCRARAEGRTADRRLTVLRFSDLDGEPLGRLVIFPCHPTVLGHRDLRLSADWPGVTSRAFTEPTLVLQGAVGDVTHGPLAGATAADARVDALGQAVARAAGALSLGRAELSRAVFRRADLDLPPPTGETLAPAGLRGLAGNVLAWHAPREAPVSVLRLGPVLLAFVPGEPTTPLAAGWRTRLAAATGADVVRIVALSDAYLGYLETPEALAAREGESRRAHFGADLVELVGEGLEAAASGDAK